MDQLTSARTLDEIAAVAGRSESPESRVGQSEPRPANYLNLLTALVSERTGYPVDMLSPDAELEADLGIDSIKRVEILGAFNRSFAAAQSHAISRAMDALTAARTLRQIAEVVRRALDPRVEQTQSRRPAT